MADRRAQPQEYADRRSNPKLSGSPLQDFRHEKAEAGRLQAKADAIGMEGYGSFFDPPRLQLAIVQNDLDLLGALSAAWTKSNSSCGRTSLGRHFSMRLFC
jgi:hypothetical protein